MSNLHDTDRPPLGPAPSPRSRIAEQRRIDVGPAGGAPRRPGYQRPPIQRALQRAQARRNRDLLLPPIRAATANPGGNASRPAAPAPNEGPR